MPTETRYTEEETWLRIDGDTATLGITDYAQKQLNELVFVKLPEVGQRVAKGKEAAMVESVKSTSEIYSPVTGEVLEVNPAIVSDPALVNSDPMEAGWFFKVRIEQKGEFAELMGESQYREYTKRT